MDPNANRQLNVLSPVLDPSNSPLGSSFFGREAEDVARDLIGCYLIQRRGRSIFKHLITETEAYLGPHDQDVAHGIGENAVRARNFTPRT